MAVDEILVQVPVELAPKVRALVAKEQAKRYPTLAAGA